MKNFHKLIKEICEEENIKCSILSKDWVIMLEKEHKIVVGDGKKTIRELLLGFNYHYFKDKLSEEEYNKILNKNEIYEYGWQFNLSKGAIPFEVSSLDLKNKLLNMASRVSSIFDVGFCSIDIVETQNNELLVMELNSGVMMENYMQIVPEGFKIAKEIYKEAINEMFKN